MFWDLNDYKLNFEIENAYCCSFDGLNRMDEDRIICAGKGKRINGRKGWPELMISKIILYHREESYMKLIIMVLHVMQILLLKIKEYF